MQDNPRRRAKRKAPFPVPLPWPLIVLGASALLIIAVYYGGVVVIRLASMVSSVLLPVVVGVLLAALLMPVQLFFNHLLKLQRHVASMITTLGTLAILGGILYMTGSQIMEGFTNIRDVIVDGLGSLEEWLLDGPLAIGREGLSQVIEDVQNWIQSNTGTLGSGVLSATSSAANILIGFLIAVIMLFFFLAEGDRMLSFALMMVGEKHRTNLREGIRRGWVTLGTWARTQLIVSAADAVGIAIGMIILGLPFIVPLTVLTFLLCFIPMLGAWLSGAVVVIVALVFEGPGAAIFLAIWVLAVQQIESQVLSPLLMGKAVNVHPLAILLGVTTGTYLMGLTGALLTVPALACTMSMLRYWQGRDPFPGLAAGKSALLDSPKDLVAEYKPVKLPSRVGGVTPNWIQRRFDEAEEAARDYIDEARVNREDQSTRIATTAPQPPPE